MLQPHVAVHALGINVLQYISSASSTAMDVSHVHRIESTGKDAHRTQTHHTLSVVAIPAIDAQFFQIEPCTPGNASLADLDQFTVSFIQPCFLK
jgi:hypothetical protein